jgi:aminocarboxymuconate-semialdehyde decarboxylase
MCNGEEFRRGLSRMGALKGGPAAAMSGALTSGRAAAEAVARPAIDCSVRVIYIHARYFPQAYLDLLAREGKRFGIEYQASPEGFSFTVPGARFGPLPTKFIET